MRPPLEDVFGSVSALGENSPTKQPDELWAKAVLLASKNQAVILRVVAGEESGATHEEFKRISDKYDTIRIFAQRNNGEEEIVVNKTWLFPEVK